MGLAQDTPRRAARRTLVRRLVSTLCVLAVLFGATYLATDYWLCEVRPFETTDNAYLRTHMAQVSPRVAGYIREIHFSDNQPVKAGDLLLVIDDSDYQARVQHAEAAVQAARAQRASLAAELAVQAARVAQRVAAVRLTEAEVRRSGQDFARQKDLATDGATSLQARDNAEASVSQADARLAEARAMHAEAQRQAEAITVRLQESEAAIAVAEATLDIAQIDLARTRIHAPVSGTLAQRHVQLGQLVQPGSLLAYLVPEGDLFVEANFKETQLEDMHVGHPVEIEIDAFERARYRGVVASAAPASGAEFSILPPENATGNFTKIVRRVPVKIEFAEGTSLQGLKPGMSVTARVRVR